MCDMKKQLIRAFAVAVLLAASLAAQKAWADPPECHSGYLIAAGDRWVCCDTPDGCQTH
jgi:hypothetical protein